jgi:molecular chaperone HscB
MSLVFRRSQSLCARCARNITATDAAHATRRSSTFTPRSAQPPPPRSQAPQPRLAHHPIHTRAASSAEAPSSPQPQPHPTLPYYALFPRSLPLGPPPGGPFAVDLAALRREFLTQQAAAHPDVVGVGGGDRSALLNEAYRALADPLLRAQYVLREAHGVDVAADGQEGTAADAETLGAVMEAHEILGGAAGEGELEELKRENEARTARSVEALGAMLEGGDVEGAVREAVRLRYWVNVRESIRGWEPGRGGRVEH